MGTKTLPFYFSFDLRQVARSVVSRSGGLIFGEKVDATATPLGFQESLR
uniref:Uncharacterized protein n=1 Tax=Proteus vulgaris TaxID=585 RepID=Q8KJU4_PROVU|nr:hypothetical protein [Proteus vulgaris]